MFRPHFRYTNRIVGDLLHAEAARATLDTLAIPRGIQHELQDQRRQRLNEAAARLSGTPGTNFGAVVTRLAAKSSLSPDLETLQAAFAAVTGQEAAAFRTSSELVYDRTHTELFYLPPDASEVPQLVADVLTWLQRSWTDLPGIVLAGIAQQEVLQIQPFDRAAGLVSRLCGDIILWRRGYGFSGFAAVDEEFARSPEQYEAATRSTHAGVYANPIDFTPWLEYYVPAVATAGNAALAAAREATPSTEDRANGAVAAVALRDRQRQAMERMRLSGAIRSGEYQRMVHVVPDTARRDFDQLMASGLISVRGVGRGTHYVLTAAGLRETERWLTENTNKQEAGHGT